jgi:hypothetical protein
VLCDHGGLVAVQWNGRGMEALLGVPQLPLQVSHSALKDAPKEARDQGPTDTYHKGETN